MWLDTHCHLDAAEFDADRALMIQRAHEAGVQLMVVPAVSTLTFVSSRDVARQCRGAYALGIHPLYVRVSPEQEALADLARTGHSGSPSRSVRAEAAAGSPMAPRA